MKKINDPDRTLLQGLAAVTKYTGYSVSTIRRWAKHHAFPLGKLPDGSWLTSTELIDRWILARRMYLNRPRGGNAPARYEARYENDAENENDEMTPNTERQS